MLINNQFYFVHIPRTGGRYIENLFRLNNFSCNFTDYTFFQKDKVKQKDIDVAHFEYPYYLQLTNKKDLTKFTVVREPVSRFKSLLKATLKINNVDLNEENVKQVTDNLNTFINNQIISTSHNWFVPQVNFISYDTHIWKYENGLDQKFIEWLNKNFDFKFDHISLDYEKGDYDLTNDIEFTPSQINSIKNYYYKDYKVIYG